MSTRREVLAGSAVAGLAAALGARPARGQARPPSLDELYAPAAVADVALSPDGKRLAVLHNRPTGKGYTESSIELVDTARPDAPPRAVKLGAYEASSIAWASDRRLMVWMIYDVTRKGFPTEKIRRVVALDDDGTKPAVMFGNRGAALQYIYDLGTIIDPLPDDPDHVMMAAWEALRGLPALYKVDVGDGSAVVMEYGALRTDTWLTQNGQPMIRLDSDSRGAMVRIMARGPGDRDWKLVHAMRVDQARDFDIYGAAQKAGVFYCAARRPGEDKVAVREVELANLAFGAPLFAPKPADADGVWLDGRGALMGWTWVEDRRRYEFADAGFAAHFAAIEGYFGGELNVVMKDADAGRTRYLGVASGPREPAAWFLYDRARRSVVELGRSAPALTRDRLGPVHALEVKTRDGGRIRAYLTAPASGAPGPLVVMPHGGPEARDTYGFDLWAQAMAARGWWVLQPNFRGSGGYGLAFAEAGWRRWGERMQADVEDAVDQALADFKLNRDRVAILGASYGGYAALMGAVRRPDAYKAVVSIAGVSDLPEMLRWERAYDETPEKDHYAFWRARIGDPAADAAMLAEASPRRRAAEIKAPVLLAHGILDQTVPVQQSRDMAKALRQANKPVEYVELKKAGHSPATPAADKELLARCLDFLGKALV